MIDYAEVGSDPQRNAMFTGSGLSNMSSPSFWMLGPGGLGPSPPRFGDVGADVVGEMEPSIRLNEMEYLLNNTPQGDNLIS